MANVLEGLGAEIIDALTGGARTALPYIVHGTLAGLSANLIGSALEASGLGIRRSALLTLVRSIRGSVAAAQYQKGLSPDQFPDASLFQSAESFMRNTFAYIVEVSGTNVFTGQPEIQHITISTNTPLTNEGIEDYVNAIIERGINTYALTLDDFDVVQVLVDPRFLP